MSWKDLVLLNPFSLLAVVHAVNLAAVKSWSPPFGKKRHRRGWCPL